MRDVETKRWRLGDVTTLTLCLISLTKGCLEIPPPIYLKKTNLKFTLFRSRPAYMYASIYRSILFWATVHVTLSVGYAAVISQWTLDIFRKF